MRREKLPGSLLLKLPLLTTLFFFFFFFCLSVSAANSSPYRQQENDRILRLPGQSFDASFAHYSGYVDVGESGSGRALFYWFFEAAADPDAKPLVLWLTGGPGCSSIAYGMAEEVGPIHVNVDGKSIHLNPYSWNQDANMLFLDSPVGVGFSYSNKTQDVYRNGDTRTANDSLDFLKKWFERFPQYKGRDFYLTGESYAGHFVPQLAQAIVNYQKLTGDLSINIKGYMVGNALTDDYLDHYGVFEYYWTVGLISDRSYEMLNLHCASLSFLHKSPECDDILDSALEEMGDIDIYSIFSPTCTSAVTFSRNKLLKRLRDSGKMGNKYDPCIENYSTVYFNSPEVQKALHVNPAFAPPKWITCSNVINENWNDTPNSVLNIYHELIQHGLRIWMVSGDADGVIPVASTRYSIEALNLPTVTPWHAWYDDDGQVGGRTQVYEGLTFVTVRGAGHEVPLHRPKQALILFKSFLFGSAMPTRSNFNDS